MNPELAEKWCKALESGKYIQGHGQLQTTIGGEKRYCCLGVLCEIVGHDYNQNYCTGFPIYDEDGIQNFEGLTAAQQKNLVSLNDESDYTFEQIAAYIREYIIT